MSTPPPREEASPRSTGRLLFLLLAALVVLVWFSASASRPLFNPDEGRYAEIPREMLVSGDWVIPRLDGLVYIEKPPLEYWATALSYRLFGLSEFSARLYSSLTALGTLLIVFFLVRALWNERAAWRAAAILVSLSLFPVIGQMLSLDASLSFYMTAALGAFLMAQSRPGRGMGWMLLAWSATALAVLTKGLEAVAIPAATLVFYTVLSRDWPLWRRLAWMSGLPLFLAIAVPWHWLAERRVPGFLQYYIVDQHFVRYLTPAADREAPWWFFGAVFLAGTLPWTVTAVRVLFGGWRTHKSAGVFDAPRFLWVWIAFTIVFFSLSDSKLVPYLLPVMPPLAILIALRPASSLRRDLVAAAVLTLLVAAALLGAHFGLARLLGTSPRAAYFLPLRGPILRIAAVLGLSAAFVLLRRDRDPTGGAVFLGAGWCLGVLLLIRAAALVAPLYSGRALAADLPPADRGVPIYSVETYDQTLPFYWRRTVDLVAYRGELNYGLRRDPKREIPTIAAFVARWRSSGRACAVMDQDLYRSLQARGVPMRELGHDGRHVLVSRR
ncbi:MAG: phospholipid carrier-dependent glycosyltransferase [Steroidobacteraceae bacterium]|nr:phospholipid carrier-dependent glycosyltransferase [Steroidobacteraceae bacterium]